VPGKYWVDVWDDCGNKLSDTLEITLIPTTVLDLGPDRSACAGAAFTYQLPAPFTAWHWYPDDHLSCADCPTVVTTAPANTTYIIVGEMGGCLSADTLTIQIVGDSVLNQVQLVTCPGEPAVYNGQNLTPGAYPFAYLAANGCDSTVLVTVLEIDSVLSQVQLVTCPGEPAVYNGQNLTPGAYPFAFLAANGCDSTVLVTVLEIDSVLSQVQLVTCPGEPAVYNGQNLTPGGPYPFAFLAANGCDSTVLVMVLEIDSVLSQVQLVTCTGEPAVYNGQNLTPGAYPFAYLAANGCDSTVLVTVLEIDSVLSQVQLVTCPGEPAVYNGQNLTPGAYPFAFLAANGCDSTVLVTVLEIDSVLSQVQLVTCPGEPAVYNGQNLTPGGPYPFGFLAANGCDSTVLVTVLEIDSVLSQVQLVTCPGEPAVYNGQNLTPGGPYPFAFLAANGCDSTVLVMVLEIDSVLSQVQLVTCSGEPAVYNGQNLLPGGPYPFAFLATNGCDSTVLVTVLEIDSVLSQVQLVTCPGEPAVYNSQNLLPGGPYPFAFLAANGCDSTVLVTVLEIDSVLSQVQLVTCPGEPAVYNGQNLLPGGPYPFAFLATNGCDSTVLVTVIAMPGVTIDLPSTAQVGLGQSIQLTPVVFGEPPLQFAWTPPDQLSCSACSEPFASPEENTWYTLKVTDSRGCMATDSIWLRVEPVCDVYMANAFQPDDDGRNDWFYPETASCVRVVRVFRVYSRWGELVFERRDFAPNQETLGWDGRFDQRDMMPGVFAWYAEFELTNGQRMLVKGDVTLVR
jgi:hypothetical protein